MKITPRTPGIILSLCLLSFSAALAGCGPKQDAGPAPPAVQAPLPQQQQQIQAEQAQAAAADAQKNAAAAKAAGH